MPAETSVDSKFYDVLHELGRGMFGTVYLCAKKHNKQKLVMKEIKTNLQGDDLRSAKNEISILKSLRHPNVILYYDSYSKKNVFYIMMEYATKGTLNEYLYKRKKKLSAQRVMNYFCQILMGLDHIHEKKVIHRDLKCENIFLTGGKADVVKIGDFGISTLTVKNSFAKTVVGTCNYLAPELCEEKPYDNKVDIWSLGCILYELCMREKMFEGSLSCVVKSITRGVIKKVDILTYGSQIQEIIKSTMKLNPEERPDTKTLMCYPDIFPSMYVLGTTLGCIFS
ncbi:serine/threonine-protein kinase Nek8-like [Coccinella septempunctata]|uniref:serine/threonine-protein kinase Nek8-like n=1 Tax=Coccinella septempunctata TaxID=41139 RepID=UPI001D063016|nr:serine/threonine-protein kinase Nek8-like [Coccinella septempunctata]